MNRGEIFDESEFDYLLRCMDVNKEFIEEQKEKERLWGEQISTYAQECLMEQRRFIPPDIFVSTQTQLVHDVLIYLKYFHTKEFQPYWPSGSCKRNVCG
jgi:hypothetical protein